MKKDEGRKRTREHALPSWLLEVLPGEGPLTHMRSATPTGPAEQIWTTDKIDIVVRRVCDPCNTGWMSELETKARPFLTPLIQGRGRALHRGGQSLLAAWSVKTALALQLTTPDPAAPQEHYRYISTTGIPPRQALVWLGAYEGHRAGFHHGSKLRLDSPTFSTNGYGSTIIVGHLVVQVLGYTGIEDEVTVTKRGAWAQATQQIWPYVDSFVWPPRLTLDESLIVPFAQVFEG